MCQASLKPHFKPSCVFKAYKVEFFKFVIKIKNQYFSSLVSDSCFIFLEVWRGIVAGSGDRLEFGGFDSF